MTETASLILYSDSIQFLLLIVLIIAYVRIEYHKRYLVFSSFIDEGPTLSCDSLVMKNSIEKNYI